MELLNTIVQQENPIEGLKYRRERIAKKTADIKNLQFEKSLMEIDAINYIKNNIGQSVYNPFWPFHNNTFDKAFWLFHKDIEASEDNKAILDYITKTIKEKILNDLVEFKLVDIIDYNYSQSYMFIYEYTYGKKTYKIEVGIPMFERVGVDNYEYFGFSVSYQESPSIWDNIIVSLDYKKVQETLVKWLKEKHKGLK